MSRGMYANVARALGYSAQRASVESVSCPDCREPLNFGTDAIGRLTERCRRGCTNRVVTPTGDVMASVAAQRLIEAELAKAQEERRQIGALADRICENKKCPRASYSPRWRNQRFCSNICAGAMLRDRGGGKKSLGLMDGGRR